MHAMPLKPKPSPKRRMTMDLETENRMLKLEVSNLKSALAAEKDARVNDKVRGMVKEAAIKSGALSTAVVDVVERVMRMGDWRIDKQGRAVLMQGGLEALSAVTSDTVTPSVAVRDVKNEVPSFFGEQPESNTAVDAGSNPWLTQNLTQQGQVLKNDPSLAKKLAAAVGVTLKD
jgi:hypothetical protein